MNTNTEHADDTKLYAGGNETPHARTNTDAGQEHEGPHKDLVPMPGIVVAGFAVGLAVLLAILLVLGLLPRLHAKHLAEADVKDVGGRPSVGIAHPKPPAAKNTLQVPGDAQAFQLTSIYPRTSGYLKKRYVDIGDSVKEGQLLAEIDAPEVDAQLASAQATLQQTTAAQVKARDDYNLAEATYQRYEGFARTGGVTTQQLDERQAAFTSAKAALAGANANVKVSEAEVQRLTALVGFARIIAPFNGTITTRGYDVGALLTANNSGSGRELFQITQTDVLRVFVDIPQTYATLIKVGEPVKFNVRNYPGKQFDGYIARLSGAINQQSRTMRVEADFPNKDGQLYPGMYGTLKYESEPEKGRLSIPSSALMFGPEGLRIATVDESNKIRFRNVTVATDLGTEVELAGSVSPTDRVVSNPGERLADGLEVDVGEAGGPKAGPTVAGGDGTKSNAQTAEASSK